MKPKTTKDIVFVGLQFFLFLAFIVDVEVYTLPDLLPDFIYGVLLALAIGLFVLSILQLNTNLSPFPSPKTQSELITSGIFKFIRHPIYSSLIIGLVSWSLYQHSTYQLGISIILIVLFYFKSDYEERLLMQKFENYHSYKQKTGRFFPKLY